MRSVAIEKAREHLELAKAAAEELDLERGIKAYEQAWSQFLSQASRFYSKLEQGSKGCSKSEPWFGRKKHERTKDPLLSYIHHARNSDEHGIDYITRTRAKSGSIKFPEANEARFSAWVRINSDGTMDVKNPTVKTPAGEYNAVVLEDPRVELVKVYDRGVAFDPPEMHLGRPIVGRNPPEIAKLAIDYLEAVLKEASDLPQRT